MRDPVIGELQRQSQIITDAITAAQARGETYPMSGMPGNEEWQRRALREAGETYIIRRGERVPL